MVADDGLVELSEAINAVRAQLVTAQLAGRQTVAGQVLTFGVGKVSLEFTGEMRQMAGGSGGVKFWVLTADAKAERTTASGHKIAIELVPLNPDGSPYRVSGGVDAPPTE